MISGAGKCTQWCWEMHKASHCPVCLPGSFLFAQDAPLPHQNRQQLCINLIYLQVDVRNLSGKSCSYVELVDELNMTKQGVLLSKKRWCISKLFLLQMKSFKQLLWRLNEQCYSIEDLSLCRCSLSTALLKNSLIK